LRSFDKNRTPLIDGHAMHNLDFTYPIPHLIMRLLVFSLVCVCIALPMTTIHETVEEKQRHWFGEVFSLNGQNNRNTTDNNITTTVGYPPTDQMTYHPCLRSLPALRSLTDAAQLKQIAPLTSLIFPLHANSGTHHAYLYIGTPPQRQTLIIDTGSRITAFPCHPYCFDCAVHASKQFYLNASSSHAIVPCEECRLNQVELHLGDWLAACFKAVCKKSM